MSRFLGMLCLAVVALLAAGCVAPAIRFPIHDVAVQPIEAPAADDGERVVESPDIEHIADRRTDLTHELKRATRAIIGTQPPQPAPDSALSAAQQIKSIRQISLDISPRALADDQQLSIAMPTNYAAEALPLLAQQQPFTRSDMAETGFDWHPSVAGLTFCYQPLYFEEPNLERYGFSHGIVQPFVSAAAFYGRIPLLPYMVFAQPARRCTEHAHWTLPGYKIPEPEPHTFNPSPLGAAAETAAVYGLILLIP